ncbi:capsular exopolysaccharide synthesis family protein [Litoreibacter meonggei]|uniref:Capsular exopolysaccharide synthesis family protein n=1 Tax=Litoreibacter meonggei TaxID=1049199 RepID=A0A497VHN4_9RHOB|nr:CpsD/CapB family tyrosine-protein kinase [Litoreibacter meonggei]RLJ36193.1 capsular exopolysaccharide synthesis family protein [Litoreibacter meonggei]
MEKLQKALGKARKQRGDVTSDASGRKASDTLKGGVLLPVPPVWDELTPFEPNLDVLMHNRVMTLNAQAVPNPFDILRTKVFLLMRQNGWKRVAITSPTKSCGKTTTACNLAVGFSRQRENRTMLFDVDLRRPGVAKVLGHKPQHGIKSLLTGDVTPQEQMLRLRTNVALSMAHNPVSDPTQLLLAQQTSEVLDDIQTEFTPDIMIFDLPPMLVTDDARAFLKNVDCALIVARAEQTRMSELDICEREVGEHTNVLGVVLNNCRHVADEEQYYGEYS